MNLFSQNSLEVRELELNWKFNNAGNLQENIKVKMEDEILPLIINEVP